MEILRAIARALAFMTTANLAAAIVTNKSTLSVSILSAILGFCASAGWGKQDEN